MNAFEELKVIIAEVLQEDDIKLETDLREDLGADSIDITEMAMAIEDKFDIEVETEAVAGVKTVQDVVDYLEKKLAE